MIQMRTSLASVAISLGALLCAGGVSSDSRPAGQAAQGVEVVGGGRDDLRALLPHLRISALDSHRLRVHEERVSIKYGYEVWKDGKIVSPVNWASVQAVRGSSCEIVSSVQSVGESAVLTISVDAKEGQAANSIVLPEDLRIGGPMAQKALEEPVSLMKGEQVPIWCWGIRDEGPLTLADIAGVARQCKWAVVVTVRADNPL
jgi:hypothetical protein